MNFTPRNDGLVIVDKLLNSKIKIMKSIQVSLLIILIGGVGITGCQMSNEKKDNPQFVIEREIPGAGNLTADELKDGSKKSCEVLRELGPEIKWLHSYVTSDKIYCVYSAPNKALIIEHAKRVGVPANLISEVKSVVSPTTAN